MREWVNGEKGRWGNEEMSRWGEGERRRCGNEGFGLIGHGNPFRVEQA